MVRVIMGCDESLDWPIRKLAGCEQFLQCGSTGFGCTAGVNERPPTLLLERVHVDMIEVRLKRQPYPPNARCHQHRFARWWRRIKQHPKTTRQISSDAQLFHRHIDSLIHGFTLRCWRCLETQGLCPCVDSVRPAEWLRRSPRLGNVNRCRSADFRWRPSGRAYRTKWSVRDATFD